MAAIIRINTQQPDIPTHRVIVSYCFKNRECKDGALFRKLKIAAYRRHEALYSLMDEGWDQHSNNSSFIEIKAKRT